MNKKWIFAIAAAGVLLVSGYAAAQFSILNYKEPGGSRTVIGGTLDVISGGDLDIESGGVFSLGGVTVTPSAAELNSILGIAGAAGLAFANGETLNTNVDDVFDFTRNDAGVVTFTCSDDDGTAGCIYDAGGASPIVIGSVDVTAVTITTDDTGDGTDLVLPAQSVNGSEMLNDTVTAVQTANDLCLQIISVEINPTEASATEDYINLVDNGFSATETDEDMFRVPVAVVAHSLAVSVATAPGNGNDPWNITLRDDAAGSSLTCEIDESATTCVDSTNEPVIAVLSKLDILVSSVGGDNDPTGTTSITISFCLGQ